MCEDVDNGVVSAVESVGNSFVEHAHSFLMVLKNFLTWKHLFQFIGALVVITLLWVIYRLVLKGIKKLPEKKVNSQYSLIIQRAWRYIFYIAVVFYILSLFGVKLSAIWGAAGIAGVAIGFASQTSVSNIISGLFVLTEGSMKIGDTIIVGGITGIVDSINLISIRVHTYDNEMVRIPNSTIISTNLMNKSYHQTRRLTLGVSVSYDTDMRTALEVLSKAPSLCPTVISEPAPAVWFDGFGESGINMTVAVWFESKNFIQTKNDLYIAIKTVFDEAGISIPFNQLDVKIKNE